MSSKQPWLQLILHLTTRVNDVKKQITGTSVFRTMVGALKILLLEILLAVVSLPAYLFVAQVPGKGTDATRGYRLRRAVTFGALLGIVALVLVKLGIGFFVTYVTFGKSDHAQAFAGAWDFNSAVEYVYDPDELQIVDGAAIFRATTLYEAVTETPTVETTLPETVTPEPETIVPDATMDTTQSVEVTPSAETSVTVPVDVTPEPVITPAPSPTPTPASTPLFYAPPLFRIAEARAATLPSSDTTSQSCSTTLRPVLPRILSTTLFTYTGFIEVADKGTGEITYQLSRDAGLTWEWWNGTGWTAALAHERNTATVISTHINDFPVSPALLFKARFANDCSSDMRLFSIAVEYEETVPQRDESLVTPFTLSTPAGDITFANQEGTPITETQSQAYVHVHGTPVAFIEAQGDVHVSAGTFGRGARATWMNLAEPVRGAAHLWLMVPKYGATDLIRICPTATIAHAIHAGCPGEITLSTETPSVPGFALARLDHPDYWYVEAGIDILHFGLATVPPEAESGATENPSTPETNELTILATVTLEELNADPTIISVDNAYSLQYEAPTNSITFTVQDEMGNQASAHTLGVIAPESAQVIAATFTGETLFIFVDGELAAREDVALDLAPVSAAREFGDEFSTVTDTWTADPPVVTVLDHALSPLEINQLVLEAENDPPTVVAPSVIQEAHGVITIEYTLADPESNYVALPSVEYSTTGAFAGEELPVTEAVADFHNDGVLSLTTSPEGEEHVLVWDAAVDLHDISEVWIAITPADGITEGTPTVVGPIAVDTEAPEVHAVAVTQLAGSDTMDIAIEVSDNMPGIVEPQVELSVDHGETWLPATRALDTEAEVDLAVETTPTEIHVAWSAGVDLPHVDASDILVQVTVTDGFGNTSVPVSSTDVSVDTDAPFGLDNLEVAAFSDTEVVIVWTPPAGESHFADYELTLEGGGRTFTWDVQDDPDLAESGTAATVITGLEPETIYHIEIAATDTFGNEIVLPPVEVRTGDTHTELSFLPVIDVVGEVIVEGEDQEAEVVVSGTAEPETLVTIAVDGIVVAKDVLVEADGSFEEAIPMDIGQHEVVVTGDAGAVPAIEVTVVMPVALEGTIDGAPPAGLDHLATLDVRDTEVVVSWTPATDEHFIEYELVVRPAVGPTIIWDATNDPDLASAGTASTVIEGLSPNTEYEITITATDAFGQEVALPPIAVDTAVTADAQAALPDAAPFIPVLDVPGVSLSGEVTVSGTTEVGTDIAIVVDGVILPVDAVHVDVAADGSFSGIVGLPDGHHEIAVVTIDNAVQTDPSNVVAVDVGVAALLVAAAPEASVTLEVAVASSIMIGGNSPQDIDLAVVVDGDLLPETDVNLTLGNGQFIAVLKLAAGTHEITVVPEIIGVEADIGIASVNIPDLLAPIITIDGELVMSYDHALVGDAFLAVTLPVVQVESHEVAVELGIGTDITLHGTVTVQDEVLPEITVVVNGGVLPREEVQFDVQVDGLFSVDFELPVGEHEIVVRATQTAGQVLDTEITAVGHGDVSVVVLADSTMVSDSTVVIIVDEQEHAELVVTVPAGTATVSVITENTASSHEETTAAVVEIIEAHRGSIGSRGGRRSQLGSWSDNLESSPNPVPATPDGGNVSGGFFLGIPAAIERVASVLAEVGTFSVTPVPLTEDDVAVPVAEDLRVVAALHDARVSPLLAKPQVTSTVSSKTGRTITLTGTAVPLAQVAVFIHSEQAVMYSTTADVTGHWELAHRQRDVELAPGEHTIYSIVFDPGSGVKSEPSELTTFSVNANLWTSVAQYLHWQTTLITVGIAVLAMLSLVLRRRGERA